MEIQGIPLLTRGEYVDTNEIFSKIGGLTGVNVNKDVSVSHRLPIGRRYKGKSSVFATIVKFVSSDGKESFYRARKE